MNSPVPNIDSPSSNFEKSSTKSNKVSVKWQNNVKRTGKLRIFPYVGYNYI